MGKMKKGIAVAIFTLFVPASQHWAEKAEVVADITPPSGFEGVNPDSFQRFLLNLSLKQKGAPVRLYDGSLKQNQSVHYRVIDLPIGNRNLHQCADGIFHLQALFHWHRKEYNKIKFHFVSGHLIRYADYAKGWQPQITGNRVRMVQKQSPGINRYSLYRYLDLIYAYSGTLSLYKESRPIPAQRFRAGDILIEGGSPGHAVIAIAEAQNLNTGDRLFLLAQSYMPAQELHVLKNVVDPALSPWYHAPREGAPFRTPEWIFPPGSLRRLSER